MEKKYLAQIIATDNEGLQMISACTAGAKVKVSGIKYLSSNKVFLLSVLRSKIETNQENVEALFGKIDTDSETIIQISIEDKTVVCGDISFSFSLDDFSQKRIIEGLDKIDITLGYLDQIENFSQSRKHWKPKLV